jgi:hypothetical protein
MSYAGTNADDFQLQFRYGSTTLTSNYYGGGFHYKPDNSVTFGFSGSTQATLAADSGVSNRRSSYQINFNQVGTGSSTEPNFFGIGFSNQGEKTTQFSCGSDATQNFTGFLLKSSSSNITGEYQVYGLAI